MAKSQRFNNSLVRCGNSATIACTCGTDTICTLSTTKDVFVTPSGLVDCPAPCAGGVAAFFNGNTFQCVWSPAPPWWVWTNGTYQITVFCTLGTTINVSIINLNGLETYFLQAVLGTILPQTVLNAHAACGFPGPAVCCKFGQVVVDQ